MNKFLITALATLVLSACSSTWHGTKEDAGRNWDKTENAVKKGGNAVGRGISHVGEKLENATE